MRQRAPLILAWGAFVVVFVVVIQQGEVAEASLTRYDGQGIDGPRAITSGPDGALWFINDFGGSVGRITTGGVVDVFDDPGLVTPSDITTGPDGNLWVTNLNGNSISRITPGGAFTTFAGVGARSAVVHEQFELDRTADARLGELCALEQRRRLVEG